MCLPPNDIMAIFSSRKHTDENVNIISAMQTEQVSMSESAPTRLPTMEYDSKRRTLRRTLIPSKEFVISDYVRSRSLVRHGNEEDGWDTSPTGHNDGLGCLHHAAGRSFMLGPGVEPIAHDRVHPPVLDSVAEDGRAHVETFELVNQFLEKPKKARAMSQDLSTLVEAQQPVKPHTNGNDVAKVSTDEHWIISTTVRETAADLASKVQEIIDGTVAVDSKGIAVWDNHLHEIYFFESFLSIARRLDVFVEEDESNSTLRLWGLRKTDKLLANALEQLAVGVTHARRFRGDTNANRNSGLGHDYVCPECTGPVGTDGERVFDLVCGHRYCGPCLIRHFSENEVFPMRCKGDDGRCGRRMELCFLEGCMPYVAYHRTLRRATASFISRSPELFFPCPAQDCAGYFDTSDSGLRACIVCFRQICTTCRTKAHEGRSCSSDRGGTATATVPSERVPSERALQPQSSYPPTVRKHRTSGVQRTFPVWRRSGTSHRLYAIGPPSTTNDKKDHAEHIERAGPRMTCSQSMEQWRPLQSRRGARVNDVMT